MKDKKLNFIDLFAGAGGLSEGFIVTGFIPIAHVEMNKYACDTLKTRTCYYYLKENNKLDRYYAYIKGEINQKQLYALIPNDLLDTVINVEVSNDTIQDIFGRIDSIIEKSNFNEVDVIVGGPPCQAYSLVGRAVDRNGMKDDDRNFLYKQYIKFLKKYSPKMFIFENVPGILTANGGKTYKNIIAYFKRVGYEVEQKILNAYDFGVLQNRKRVIIVGWKKGSEFRYPVFDKIETDAIVEDILKDLSPIQPGEKKNQYSCNTNKYLTWSGIRKCEDVLTLHECRKHNERDRKIYEYVIKAWSEGQIRLKYTDLPESLCTHKNRKAFLDRFKVVAADMPYSHTMLAHISKDGHYFIHPDIKQCRSISVREAARIQSFPDNYFFEGPITAIFAQIGNAVPPLMGKEIARKIKKMING